VKIKSWQKNSLSVIVIAIGGFILFYVIFILLSAIMRAGNAIARLIVGQEDYAANPMQWRFIFIVIILCISWLIFRSKFNNLIKATYLTATLMVLYVMGGLLLYGQPQWMPLGVGSVIGVAVIIYLYKKKCVWQYYFATIYTSVLAVYVLFSGVDI